MFLYGQSMLRICKRQVAVWMYLYKKNSRMKIIPIIQCAAMLGCIADSAFAKEAGRPDGTVRPNFIVIFVDDLGYNDLGFRNSSFNTPNIDRLASQSVNFVNAYVPSPTSSPSRAALLTGKYPVKQGITRHINSRNEDPFGTGEYEMLATDPGHIPNRRFLPKSETTIADVLNSAGYRTVAVGKWHLGTRDYYPDRHGFDEMYGESDLGHPASYFPDYFVKGKKRNVEGKYLTDSLTDFAVEAILGNDYSEAPLFLYLAHYGVHSPHMAPEDLTRKYIERGIEERYAVYHAMVESVDISTGRIMDAIDKAGIGDNTVLLFISDQGGYFSNAPLRGGKLTGALYEGGARVPFLVRSPDVPEGTTVDARISTLDVFPTLVEYAGLPPGNCPDLDGQSLYGTIHGGVYREKPIFFYRSYDDQPAAVICNDFKFIWSRKGDHELYDLKTDPNEIRNLAGVSAPGYRKAWRKCHKLLSDFLSEYEPNPVY